MSDTDRKPSTAKGRARREAILDAATLLFYEHGYHATGIDDIGGAAGITGPGVYRHFAGKDEVLAAVFDRLWLRLVDAIERADELPAGAGLDLLVANHVDLVVDHRAEVVLLLNELRNLPEDYQRRAAVNDATYQQAWADRILKLHPHVSDGHATSAARSAMWSITAYDHGHTDTSLDPDEAKRMLTGMAGAVINSLAQ